ncbi:MAG: 4-hydroxy-3-methylbut-2-enyl diphosphate reductase [Candidatus Marinimicrobia bacterium]|nr:4-hydroxy-3-methylbut-2-enyl diphosphate reductase [Candidatus Neomarinimicrobiota bacterium]|tara:strand:+ start:120 stop:968 length:849 start_codon:yes stop_codon:yes gene_type:complete
MKIIVAKDAGYCFGVRDAVNMAYDATEKYGSVYMLGDIVHNERVVKDLANSGAKVVETLDDVPNDSPVLFRAHGTVNELWEESKQKNMNVIDATCPLVHEIHREIKKLAEKKRKIIVIGDHGHDEVVAIANQVDNAVIISSPEEARQMKKWRKAGVVSQSTQTIENVQEIMNILMTKVFDLHFVNTICFPTKRNQEQIKMLADTSDVMIIIGSFTSANSKRLTQLALEKNKNSFQVTCADDLKKEWFENIRQVGISAGASTPDELIEEVKEKILNINEEILD